METFDPEVFSWSIVLCSAKLEALLNITPHSLNPVHCQYV